MSSNILRESEYYEIIDGEERRLQCHLCPHECKLDVGDKGICHARMNIEGKLYSLTYGFVEMKIDLIEKQNVYHFFPNSRAQTFSTFDCNLDCTFCQFPEKAHIEPEKITARKLSPDQAVMFGAASGSRVISFGESEPLVSFEWVRDTAKLAKERGLKTLLRTNAYFKEAPITEILEYIDAVKVNIKASNSEGYLKICGGGKLDHIKNMIKLINGAEKLVEISFIVHEEIGNTIDSVREITEWIVAEVSKDVPFHITRLKPAHRVKHLTPTKIEYLEEAYLVAKNSGLSYVYLDNVPNHETNNTYCPKCGELLIERTALSTEVRRVTLQGKCNKCQADLNIILS
ncbi:MAG: AmmeMemoRadiSam system radical SAM enzyme [Candidatus Heimdallarchaeaceae archaeon]